MKGGIKTIAIYLALISAVFVVSGGISPPQAYTGAFVNYVVTNTDDSGGGSLRQAIIDANTHGNVGGPDFITFNIPSAGPHTISPGSALPPITDPVTIDGYTQGVASPNDNPPTLAAMPCC